MKTLKKKTTNPTARRATDHTHSSELIARANNASNSRRTLPMEVREIRRLHGEVWDMRRMSLDKGIRIGELLAKLKHECGHGKWLQFVGEKLPFCERTAQVYMEFYRERDSLKSAENADLPMCRALRLMPKTKARRPRTSTEDSRAPLNAPGAEVNTPATSQTTPLVMIDAAESNADRHEAAMTPGATEIHTGSDGAPLVSGPPSGNDDTDRQEEVVTLQFLDGTPVVEWQDGLISTEKLGRDLRKIENLPASVPRNERLAQQLVFAAAAFAINRVIGTDPEDGTLKAVETALLELRNAVVAHKNYHH